jgi:hypothetical protein
MDVAAVGESFLAELLGEPGGPEVLGEQLMGLVGELHPASVERASQNLQSPKVHGQ